jgi:hypothetical protein
MSTLDIYIIHIMHVVFYYPIRRLVYMHYSKAPFKTHIQECTDCFLRAEFVKGRRTHL